MEIPYTVTPRQDTGLWNAKIGIWLFLASEVMLFGGLFSGYVFLRLGAEPGYWPHGLLNVPVGTMNTAILILSSVTVVLAWAALKMRQFTRYRIYMAFTILCGIIFLVVKLGYEWPQKYDHFGAYIRPSAIEKYEKYLGNKHLAEEKLPLRYEITGHLHEVEVNKEGVKPEDFDALVKSRSFEIEKTEGNKVTLKVRSQGDLNALNETPGLKVETYELGLDAINAEPDNRENDRPHFWFRLPTNTPGTIAAEDVEFASMFMPRHNSYFAAYFTITGLHGLHVLAGVLVFIYYMLPTSTRLYRENPEHFANRVEVAGLFWHFVDLVWIFVFPIFYLL